MSSTQKTPLMQAVRAAQEVSVSEDFALQQAEELVRWSRIAESRKARGARWWAGMGAISVIAGFAIWVFTVRVAPATEVAQSVSPVETTAQEPVAASLQQKVKALQVGPRVGMVATDDAEYSLLSVSATTTEIEVLRGAVTARLFAGPAHQLRLQSEGLVAAATGTLYTLMVDEQGRSTVVVHEGTVDVSVTGAAKPHSVVAGQSWPAHSLANAAQLAPAVEILQRMSLRQPLKVEVKSPPTPQSKASVAVAPTSVVEDWRAARLKRGQGEYREAIRILDDIIAAEDSTWSPLAMAESMRIYDSVLSDPKKVLAYSQRFAERYPSHSLLGEVQTMGCRARLQLGHREPCPEP